MNLLQQRGLVLIAYYANPSEENREKVLMANKELNEQNQ